MPITFDCSCGKTLRVPDQHAGKRVKCPACNGISNVPEPEPMFEVVEDPSEQLAAPSAPVRAKPAARSAVVDDDEDDRRGYGVAKAGRNRDDDDDDDDEPRAKKKPDFRKGSRRRDEDDEEEEERPRKKKRRPRSRRKADPDAGKRIGYMVGGVVLVLVGIGLAFAGWNMEGRGATRLLIFGVILAFCGLGTTVRGITGNFDDE
jgi:hypothetical protein